MVLLVLGVLLWVAGHFWKRILPEAHAAMGDKARGVSALIILLGVVAMIFGYRAAPIVDLWYPPAWTVHVNNLLVLIALYLLSPAPKKGRLLNNMRHPQLAGFRAWAFAHLLVNGDVASVVLFGGLLIWAAAEVVVINRAEPEWTPRAPGTYAMDGVFAAASVVLLGVIGWIHGWLGPWPFPG